MEKDSAKFRRSGEEGWRRFEGGKKEGRRASEKGGRRKPQKLRELWARDDGSGGWGEEQEELNRSAAARHQVNKQFFQEICEFLKPDKNLVSDQRSRLMIAPSVIALRVPEAELGNPKN